MWRKFYHPPETHPNISPEELELILKSRHGGSRRSDVRLAASRSFALLRFRQTWGIVAGRSLLDPYWFMIAEWFAIYLVSKGFRMEESGFGFWAPFLAADLGNFFGGGLSSYWIRRGWSVGKSRRMVVAIFGPSMLLLIPAAFSGRYWVLIGLFAFSDVCLCGLLDHIYFATLRRVSQPRGGHRQRHERLWRRRGDGDLDAADRASSGPHFLSADHHRGVDRALPGGADHDYAGAAAEEAG